MSNKNKEEILLPEEEVNPVVEGTDNQNKDNNKKETISKSAQRTEQNLTNTDVANAQNLQYEQGTIQKLREEGKWYKMSRAEKKEVRNKINQEEEKKAKQERESKFVEQKEEEKGEEGPNDSQKQLEALKGKKLEPQYIADNNEIQRDDIMNKELNKNLEVANETNKKVAEEQKKKQEEQAKKEQKK